MGSSSSGSKSGLSLGGSVRNRLHAIWKTGWDVVIFIQVSCIRVMLTIGHTMRMISGYTASVSTPLPAVM